MLFNICLWDDIEMYTTIHNRTMWMYALLLNMCLHEIQICWINLSIVYNVGWHQNVQLRWYPTFYKFDWLIILAKDLHVCNQSALHSYPTMAFKFRTVCSVTSIRCQNRIVVIEVQVQEIAVPASVRTHRIYYLSKKSKLILISWEFYTRLIKFLLILFSYKESLRELVSDNRHPLMFMESGEFLNGRTIKNRHTSICFPQASREKKAF